jgi:hypothetical protein
MAQFINFKMFLPYRHTLIKNHAFVINFICHRHTHIWAAQNPTIKKISKGKECDKKKIY